MIILFWRPAEQNEIIFGGYVFALNNDSLIDLSGVSYSLESLVQNFSGTVSSEDEPIFTKSGSLSEALNPLNSSLSGLVYELPESSSLSGSVSLLSESVLSSLGLVFSQPADGINQTGYLVVLPDDNSLSLSSDIVISEGSLFAKSSVLTYTASQVGRTGRTTTDSSKGNKFGSVSVIQ